VVLVAAAVVLAAFLLALVGIERHAEAAFPGVNGKIAFERGGYGFEDIYTMNADGSNQINLTKNFAQNRNPAVSPDGLKIAFESNRDGNREIYVMNTDGSNLVRLTNNPAADDHPVWSPDGSKIAFRSNREDTFEMYVMNADGSNVVRITGSDDFGYISPAWSPDGSKIAFHSFPEFKIYVMNADGSNIVRLTDTPSGVLEANPEWSPDGSKIAFLREDPGLPFNNEIYVMNADGSNQINLTNNLAEDNFPAWSPDGSKIAFASNRDHNNAILSSEIYVMNADGSNVVRVSNTVRDSAPNWGPAPADTTPPTLINLPADITAEATGPAGAQVSWQAPTATDVNPAQPIVSCSPASGSTFAIGTTPVNCSATDAANNTANRSFMVKVQDTTSPNITNVPSNITTEATSSGGATVTFTKPTATDIVDGALSSDKVSCDHQSGDPFPIATTTVTCSATDSSGNEASASFTVTVIGATEQVTDLKDYIANLNLPAGTTTALQAKLDDALSAANGGDTASACTALKDFISQVRAQQGKKKISAQDAAKLITEAQRIQAVLGCS
jgi:TolB protein